MGWDHRRVNGKEDGPTLREPREGEENLRREVGVGVDSTGVETLRDMKPVCMQSVKVARTLIDYRVNSEEGLCKEVGHYQGPCSVRVLVITTLLTHLLKCSLYTVSLWSPGVEFKIEVTSTQLTLTDSINSEDTE